jgi:hypothetical protein
VPDEKTLSVVVGVDEPTGDISQLCSTGLPRLSGRKCQGH